MKKILEGKGKFDVKMRSQSGQEDSNGEVTRFSYQKEYTGDLQGFSTGEMLSHMTSSEGSAGYVSIGKSKGVLRDKRGPFLLQHYGIMEGGEDRLIVEIIPDSADSEVKGLWVTMVIHVMDGMHSYEFEFNYDAD